MKKKLIYSLFVILTSCSSVHSKKVETLNDQNKSQIKTETTSTMTVQSTNAGSESKTTYSLTQNDNGINYRFKADCSVAIKPTTKVNMDLIFEKDNIKVNNVLNTQLFSKYMDLTNVQNIQIDSFKYKVNDGKIDLRFNVTLIREENDKAKKLDKYTIKYSSDFDNPKQTVQLVKTEKKSVEYFDGYN